MKIPIINIAIVLALVAVIYFCVLPMFNVEGFTMKDINKKIDDVIVYMQQAEEKNVPLDDAGKTLLREIAQANEKNSRVKTIMVKKILKTTDNSRENVKKAVDELFKDALKLEENTHLKDDNVENNISDEKIIIEKKTVVKLTVALNEIMSSNKFKPVDGYRLMP